MSVRRVIVAFDGSPGRTRERESADHAASRRAATVIRDAREGVVDLLITGSRSYGPLQRALLGSVSEALMEGASHPVLVVPRVGSGPMPDTVVAPDGASGRRP